jgi:hypothetical protein
MKKRVEEILDNARKGVRMEHFFMDFPKDERRGKAKVQQWKTRLISASPMDLLIAFRMLFGDFCRMFMRGAVHNSSAVGLNPYSDDWDLLAKQLLSISQLLYDGDFAGYDSSLNAIVLEAICDAINEWYNDGPEWAQARKILFQEIIHSRHVFRDMAYVWPMSEPSGHPLTAVLNSIYTQVLFRMAYGKLFGYHNLDHFDDDVYVITLGDDHVVAVREEIADQFTPLYFQQCFAGFGHAYTSSDKTEVRNQWRGLREVSFLKRGFRYDTTYSRWVAPLNLDVVLEMPLWTRKGNRSEQITRDTFDLAMEELSLHSPETFSRWVGPMCQSYRATFNECYARQNRLILLQAAIHKEYWE